MIPLEKLVTQVQDAGQQWIEAKLKSDQLDSDEKNVLAALCNSIEEALPKQEKLSELKLERLARGSKEFRDYVMARCMAQAETGRKKVRFESLECLWEAARSELAFERVKIEKGIYHEGK